jgi:phosphoglycerate dehydrogenase-like enzyme
MTLLFLPPATPATARLFTPAVAAALDALAEVERNPHARHLTEAEVVARAAGADAIVTGPGATRVSEAVVAAAPHLRLVLHAAATVKPYVSAAVYDRGITVTSGSPAIARITAEAALALVMIGNWEAKKWSGVMASGGWKTGDETLPGLRGRVIGIVGWGAITQALLPMLRPLAPARILVHSAHLSAADAAASGVELVALEDLLGRSDIVSLQTGLNARTRKLLHAGNLRLIRDGALLVNIGRGELIDEAALAVELSGGRFRAVLDVYEKEPPDPANPLRTLPNVTCFPHLGGATENGREPLGWDVVENLREYLAGKTPHGVVSREKALAQSEY